MSPLRKGAIKKIFWLKPCVNHLNCHGLKAVAIDNKLLTGL